MLIQDNQWQRFVFKMGIINVTKYSGNDNQNSCIVCNAYNTTILIIITYYASYYLRCMLPLYINIAFNLLEATNPWRIFY